jgi:hypothetical protein
MKKLITIIIMTPLTAGNALAEDPTPPTDYIQPPAPLPQSVQQELLSKSPTPNANELTAPCAIQWCGRAYCKSDMAATIPLSSPAVACSPPPAPADASVTIIRL